MPQFVPPATAFVSGKSADPEAEAKIIKQLFDQNPLREGATWFVVDLKW